MSLCLNSRCTQPNHPENSQSSVCQTCGSDLILQGRYRVMRLISDRSGFGSVYEAYERNQPKLLKVLKESLNDTPKAIELFEKEALVLNQLNHPGIPRVEVDGYFVAQILAGLPPLRCIIMEKIDGLDLRQWMLQQGNHPIGEKQAIQWLQQLTEVLHLIHHKNYFHRDIKPENIMLRETGQLVLVDFGAARQMTETYLAQLGSSEGITALSSAGYTPPEQEQGQAVPQSDFYALGRTFIYLLTAKHPTDPEIYDVYRNEFTWYPHAPQVSTAFAKFLDQMIAPRPMDRPQDTRTLLNRLHAMQIAGGRGPSSATPTLTETISRGPSNPLPVSRALDHQSPAYQYSETQALQDSMPLSPSRWLRQWWPLASASLVGLLALGGGGIWYSHIDWKPQATNQIAVDATQKSVLLVRTLTGHTSSVNAIALVPGKNQLISGSADTTIKQWDLTTGQELQTFAGHLSYVNALALSPDGRMLASGSADQTIRLWDMKTGESITVLRGHLSPINTLAISHSGRQLVSGSADGTVKLWDLETRQEIYSFQAHASAVNTLAISSDEAFFATGSADRTLRLWDLGTGENQGILRGHDSYVNTLAMTPDGRYLISGSADTTIKRWHPFSPGQEQTWLGHRNFVNDLVVTPDGQTLISASTDGSVAFWDVQTGQLRYVTTGYDSYVDRLLLLPNGQLVTARHNDATIRLWVVQ